MTSSKETLSAVLPRDRPSSLLIKGRCTVRELRMKGLANTIKEVYLYVAE